MAGREKNARRVRAQTKLGTSSPIKVEQHLDYQELMDPTERKAQQVFAPSTPVSHRRSFGPFN